MNEPTIEERVANGAQLLDEKVPGWYKLINLATLRLSSCYDCVCGQLAMALMPETSWNDYSNPYQAMKDELGLLNGSAHGFAVLETQAAEVEWAKAINARLQADAMDTVEEREVALACATT